MANSSELVTIKHPSTGVTKKVEKRLAKDYAIAGWQIVEKSNATYTKFTPNSTNANKYPYK